MDYVKQNFREGDRYAWKATCSAVDVFLVNLRTSVSTLGCVPLILPHIYKDSSRSPLLVDVIIHKKAIGAVGTADDNIRSEHW